MRCMLNSCRWYPPPPHLNILSGYPRQLIYQFMFHAWIERSTVRVWHLSQEQDAMIPAMYQTGPLEQSSVTKPFMQMSSGEISYLTTNHTSHKTTRSPVINDILTYPSSTATPTLVRQVQVGETSLLHWFVFGSYLSTLLR